MWDIPSVSEALWYTVDVLFGLSVVSVLWEIVPSLEAGHDYKGLLVLRKEEREKRGGWGGGQRLGGQYFSFFFNQDLEFNERVVLA